MANSYFQFKQFTVRQDKCAMKVTTDGCLFGAWIAGGRLEAGGSRREARGGRQEEGSGRNGAENKSVLDIGTGTGLLSLMMVQENPGIVVDAVEIDEAASEQARQNVLSSPWAERIQVIHADVNEWTPERKYDIIISNPPFYENELKGDNKQKNLAHHNEGLLLPELLPILKNNLQPQGSFYLLLPYKRHDEIRKMIDGHELSLNKLVLVRQSVNHDYFRIMLEGKLKSEEDEEISIDEIAVKDATDQYTAEFISLLKDYYLHL